MSQASGLHVRKFLAAIKRRRGKVKRQRADRKAHRLPAIAQFPECVVFRGETAVKTNLSRLRGWAPQDEWLIMDAPFGSWRTQTLIAGLTADALVTPWMIKDAMDGQAFAAYVREVLFPENAPGTAVILDNVATHRNQKARSPS